MSSSRRVYTAAEAARTLHEYASELDYVDSDIKRLTGHMTNICLLGGRKIS